MPSHELIMPEFAPHFRERSKGQRRFERKALREEEFDYSFFFGEYSRALEGYVENYIQRLLEEKADHVVVLDLGGGIGKSWMTMAKNFQREVSESRLAFIVSNLKHTPEQHILQRKLPLDEGMRRAKAMGFRVIESSERAKLEDIQFMLEEDRDRCNYIEGKFFDLPTKEITLPNGKRVPLQGNVDIIHERYSLTAWGLAPERDLFTIPRLASSHAMYLVRKGDISTPQGDLFHQAQNIKLGIKNMFALFEEKFNFTRSDDVLNTGEDYVSLVKQRKQQTSR